MRRLALAGVLALAVYLVRRSRQPIGARDRWARRMMNERLAPAMLRRGMANGAHNGIGVIEHTGRVSGTIRHTPIHPILMGGRVAVPLPYQEAGQWTQNVRAAGGCRLQFRDSLYELCNPQIVNAEDLAELPPIDRFIGKAFGGRFLVLDVTSSTPGRFEADLVPATA